MMPRRQFMEKSVRMATAVGVAATATAPGATRIAGATAAVPVGTPGVPDPASATPTGQTGAPTGAPLAGPVTSRPEYYELRTLTLRIGYQPKLVHDYLAEALLPAFNRIGIRSVGAFELTFGPQIPTVYLLIPHNSLASFGAVSERLAADEIYRNSPAAQAFCNAPGPAPAFVRQDSALLMAFDSLPRLVVPKKDPRIFELRTYENPSEAGHLKKMEMFTPKIGELEIFRRVGLTPVFFGKTLVGPRQPSFTYMLTYPDLAARQKAWATFLADPEWLKLKTTPGFTDADIMSNISDLILRPTAYSQI